MGGSQVIISEEERADDLTALSLSRNSMIASKRPDFTIIWQNLTYKVDSRHWHAKLRERIFGANSLTTPDLEELNDNDTQSRRGERTILNGICGSVESRQLTGILGPSGAGKSSLLHCLFQNRTAGVTGRILVDSQSREKLKVCFIPQKDHLNEWLTVREDLIFVSKLRSGRVNIPEDNFKRKNKSDSEQILRASTTYVKRNGSTTLVDHEENALRVADLLGITNCLDVPIRNISGGQKKRLSVARELMSTPDILILDEPTTGLDSLTCQKTISVLRDLARLSSHPMAVIVTIHQPQRSVFDLFDKTYFLANRGRVVYDDCPQNVTETMRTVANLNLPSAKYNLAATLIETSLDPTQRHILELLSNHQQTKFYEKYDSQKIKSLLRPRNDNQNWRFCAANEKESIYSGGSTGVQPIFNPTLSTQTVATNVSAHTINTASTENYDGSLSPSDEYFISRQLKNCLDSHKDNGVLRFVKHSLILAHRSWLSIVRNQTMTRSRLLFHTSLPLIMLVIFGTHSGTPNNCPQLDSELELKDMRRSMDDAVIRKNVEETRLSLENISFFYILMYGFGINIISTTASYYPLTIQMFKKETINGLYSAGPYFIGQLIADLPLEIFFPSVSIILAYSLSGQLMSYMGWRMFAVTFELFLLCYSIHSLGLLFGAIFINDINVAVLIGQLTLFPSILISGFIIRTPRMPTWMLYLSDLSAFKHALKGFVAARYGFNVCNCDEDMVPEDGSPVGFKGLPSNVKHVLDYMFPENETDGVVVADVFDKLSERFIKAQTFGLNITSCDHVKPYAMTAFEVYDSDLWGSASKLLIMILVLKILTFVTMRVSPYRID